MKTVISYSCILVLVAMAGLYLTVPAVLININRISEMLNTSSYKGLMMYYYELGDGGMLMALAAGMLQTVVPIFPKSGVLYANMEYFGNIQGTLISVIAASAGLFFCYMISHPLSKKFSCYANLSLGGKKTFAIVLLLSSIPLKPFGFVGYFAGLMGFRFRIFAPAAVIGQIVSIFLILAMK
ncbi:MAG: hypothetical protein GT589_06165 [Peptoclostridium sp.]|uniref:VTT domain-containing protein n=1 Tax=Peptoclostridium sp. TaxID=1904860 RepID=UPI00139F0B83|nr:hypothetical protein [Peptoclostridium sp.]MZQ75733.1 hypothetical protein [Peptoclostridium sp.]